jgi:hypothetical protein
VQFSKINIVLQELKIFNQHVGLRKYSSNRYNDKINLLKVMIYFKNSADSGDSTPWLNFLNHYVAVKMKRSQIPKHRFFTNSADSGYSK